MNLVKSAGGPLVCIEENLLCLWNGDISSSETVFYSNILVETDYDRACRVKDYVGIIHSHWGNALILGDMPLQTGVWKDRADTLFIFRLRYMNIGIDIENILAGIKEKDFENPEEVISFFIKSHTIRIFDSAISGKSCNDNYITLPLVSGNYIIITASFNPDSATSILLHKFQLQT